MIKWNKNYSVGISIIDEEHKKLIGILNKIIYAKEHNVNPEELEEVLREMTDYSVTHFTTEEAYIDLPPLLIPPLKLEFRIIQTVVT